MAAATKKSKDLDNKQALKDLRKSYNAKRELIQREQDDFLFALGDQWTSDDITNYEERKIKPVTDNRIQPNLFLLTGLERQNRSEFRAFPEGEEDSLKAEVASYLFKNAIKRSDFLYKTSEQFKDGITCGESHLELYLDNTYDLLNACPMWRKADGNTIFPEPGYREYDYSDARYVNKVTFDLSTDDLISLFPDKQSLIEKSKPTKLSLDAQAEGVHQQKRDYPKKGGQTDTGEKDEDLCDLVERFYKKFVTKHYLGDKTTGNITEAKDKATAQGFVQSYQDEIQQNAQAYQQDVALHQQATQQWQAAGQPPGQMPIAPIEPPQHDPARFIHFTRYVPEMWLYAFVPGVDEPLADEVAWFYPLWKKYPFVPYFARFSTAPIPEDKSHLLIQGIVRGVKNAQEIHNKTKTLELLHLNSSTNSGWLSEEDSWVDPNKVKGFGATPGVNLEYKKNSTKPDRIFPQPLSAAHDAISQGAADSIKAQLGINADLLAAEQGDSQSGRAIALRQKQGLVMVQETYDNLSRSRQIAGKLLLSQMGKMYDTETAKKVLGEAFLMENFSKPAADAQGMPILDPQGQPQMEFDEASCDQVVDEVLSGDLERYDVSVGEAVSSETMKMANMADLKDFATTFPGLIQPDLLIEESMLPQGTKTKAINSIRQAQAMAAQNPPKPSAGGKNGK